MTVISHFALPVIVAGVLDVRRIKRSGAPLLLRWHVLLIGFCGILPDLLTPHLSLQARYQSWSHTLWFFVPSLLLCLTLLRFLPPRHRVAAHLCWFAVLLHFICDMVSGGVDLIPPFGQPVGDYYFPVRYWLHLDLASLIAAYLVCWYARHMVMKNERATGELAGGRGRREADFESEK